MDVPPDQAAGNRTIAVVTVVAALLAATAALIAPTAWPEGPGRLLVVIDGVPADALEVSVGDRAPASHSLGGGVGVELPAGTPTDEPVEVRVSADDRALDVGDVDVRLELPDGAIAPIPVVDAVRDGDTTTLVASRRPPVRGALVVALLAFVATFWVAGAVPLHVPALLVPVVLTAGEAAPAQDALAPFFHPVIALFFAGFLMAEAMKRAGLDRRVAAEVVARTSGGPVRLLTTLMVLSAGLSMFMSNTAAVAVLLPIALAVSEPIGDRGYTRVLVLGLAYAATVGGVGSAIGTPANPLAIDFLAEATGERITFVEWFVIGVPFLLVFLPLMGVVLWRAGGVSVDAAAFHHARVVAKATAADLGPISRDERVVLTVFLVVVAVWLAQPWHGVDTGIVALGGAIALAVTGRIVTSDLGAISWSSLLTFGGGLSLGLALVESGVADWVAASLAGLAALPSGLAVAVIAVVVLLTTTVASNTAAAAIMIPLAIPLAGVIDVPAEQLVVVVAVASSIDFALVIGTPPTMMAYSSGLFTTRDILRRGAPLDVLGLLVLVTIMPPLWDLIGLF